MRPISLSFALLAIALVLLTSCVSHKKYMESTKRYEQLEITANDCDKQLTTISKDLESEKARALALEDQLTYLRSTHTNMLDRLSDMSVISKTGAESIKKSLESLSEQSAYIRDLTGSLRQKDSLNLLLVMNLKRSLADVNDEDITIEVKKGVVYISLSDKMLFKSGSAEINTAAQKVLEKIALVVNDHAQLDILVEGHTDNVPIANACMLDNWDLSAKRATSVVRMLQQQFKVSPERMTAGGRSEFVPKTSNETADGRRINRRTEIIILPKLDQFFQLLSPSASN